MIFWIVAPIVMFTALAVVYVYRRRHRLKTVDSFLTARGSLTTWAALGTILASEMGSWILFSLPEAGTWGGILAFGGYTIAQACGIFLFIFIGPRLRELSPRGSTLPELVYHRFGPEMHLLTLITTVFYLSVFVAAELTGVALVVNLVSGLPLWVAALLIGGGTLIYTAYGGVHGTIFTDNIEAAIFIPLMLIIFLATTASLGGSKNIIARALMVNPAVLSLTHGEGWEFFLTLLIAVIASNFFNQAYWTRSYACRDNRTVRYSFAGAGIIMIPLMLMSGFFGIMALTIDKDVVPSMALFELVAQAAPPWVMATVLVLLMALVMSTLDTLINAITSVITVEIARRRQGLSSAKLIGSARLITAILCLMAIFVSSRGYSVLYLFFVADLVCAAAFAPTLAGLYVQRLSGRAAASAILLGLMAGTILFPDPGFTRGSLLYSFTVALIVPAVLILAFNQFGEPFDYKRLAHKGTVRDH
ncbi:MAG TPA: Na+/proline symporter [bacterium]|nr:Na+/proline symporter [bacterium]